jgi:glutamate-1-semialdehyde aminotransferase
VWELGGRLYDAQRRTIASLGLGSVMEVRGFPPRQAFLFQGSDGDPDGMLVKSLLQQELLRRGILFAANQFACFSHTDEHVDETLAAFTEAAEIVGDAVEAGDLRGRLEGEPVEAIFRKP